MTEKEEAELRETVANLMQATDMHARTVRQITGVLSDFDQRLKFLEKRDRKEQRRSSLIVPINAKAV